MRNKGRRVKKIIKNGSQGAKLVPSLCYLLPIHFKGVVCGSIAVWYSELLLSCETPHRWTEQLWVHIDTAAPWKTEGKNQGTCYWQYWSKTNQLTQRAQKLQAKTKTNVRIHTIAYTSVQICANVAVKGFQTKMQWQAVHSLILRHKCSSAAKL